MAGAGAGVEESTCAASQTLSSGTTSPVNSAGSFSLQQQQQKHAKKDLWKNAFLVDVPNHPNVKIQWFELKNFTIYARAINITLADADADGVLETTANTISIRQVVELMVDEKWKRTARTILENKKHFAIDTFPSASQLLELGAVWLLHEELYCQGHGAHAHRIMRHNNNNNNNSETDDAAQCPDWNNYTLRVHTSPERHYAADLVDWGKYSKGLLLNNEITVTIAGVKPHVPIVSEGALPDGKDGAIVYQVSHLGYTYCSL